MKTRLAKAIGAPAAAEAYIRLVETLLSRLRGLPAVELRYAPDDASEEIHPWLRPGWQMRPQGSGDLGDRLQTAFSDAFANGAGRVVVIGSDCPTVSAEDIRSAWHALRKTDVVIGPATDGGYWLIGLRRLAPVLFEQMPWSTDLVFQITVERAGKAGLSLKLLRTLSDVDTNRDWEEFLARQAPRPRSARPHSS